MSTELSHALTPRRVLWTALATVLAASAVHVAGTFSTLEPGGALPVLARLGPYTGILAAVAVDLGLLGLSWGVGARKRAEPDKAPWDLWGGIAIFAVLSALANFDHALAVLGQRPPFAPGMGMAGATTWATLDRYTQVKVLALSATLPLLAIYLTRVVETAVDARQSAAGEDAADIEDGADQHTLLALLTNHNAPLYDPDWQDVPGAPAASAHTNGRAVHPSPGGAIQVAAPQATPPPKPRRATGRGKLTSERYRAIAAEHVPAGAGAQEADRIVGRVAGVSEKTAQRVRLAGSTLPESSGRDRES